MNKENKPWSAEVQANIKKLEKFYRTSKPDEELRYCPLCGDVTRRPMTEDCHNCCDCPWVIITGRVCGERAGYLGIVSISMLRRKSGIRSPLIPKSKLISLRRFRARELKQWMKHYEEER